MEVCLLLSFKLEIDKTNFKVQYMTNHHDHFHNLTSSSTYCVSNGGGGGCLWLLLLWEFRLQQPCVILFGAQLLFRVFCLVRLRFLLLLLLLLLAPNRFICCANVATFSENRTQTR